jgi:hypothetical protein
MIKRFLLFAVMAVVAFASHAEVSSMHLGYSNNELVTTGQIGISGANDVSAAIYLPQSMLTNYADNYIESIKVGLASKLNVETLTVWVREDLSGENLAQGTINSSDAPKIAKGWNDVMLQSPYTISGDKGLYIGYTFHQKGASYAISSVGTYQENGLFVKLGDSDWTTYTDKGVLSLEAMVKGDNLPKYDLSLLSVSTKEHYSIGSELPVTINVKNVAATTISGFNVACKIDGYDTVYNTRIDCDLKYDDTQEFTINLILDLTELADNVDMSVSITSLNEGDDEDLSNNSASVSFDVITREYQRNVFIEEFTTEKCSNCPSAASMLKSALESLAETYPDRIIAACHHSGYYTDWLTTSADSDYLWFYNGGGSTYAPAFMIDRIEQDDKTPVFSNPGLTNMISKIEKRLKEPAYAKLDITAKYNDAGDAAIITVNGERSRMFSIHEPRLTVYVIENNITAHNQAGASGTYIQQHVLRTYNASWGETLNWVDDKFEYNCELEIKSGWNANELEVLAFISDFDSTDATKCTIENSAKCLIEGSSVKAISAEDMARDVIYYDICGNRVSADTKGVLVKVTNYISGAKRVEKILNSK